MIKTKSIIDPAEETDGIRVLVSRYWPRGVSEADLIISSWMRELAPSKELLQDWRNSQISWQEYSGRYREEMSSCGEAIQNLANKAARTAVTLLCHEPEHNPHCHRHILRHLIEAELNREAE